MVKISALLILIWLSFAYKTHAQNIQLRGSIIDSLDRRIIKKASVIIIGSQDSMLINSTRSNQDGYFSLSIMKPGNYTLLVTYPQYVDYIKIFRVDSTQKNVDFGKVSITKLSTILKEVIVTANRSSIRLRGDTIEFDARNYHLQPNASVEDLIKKLPGLQIDNFGNVTAQGKAVTKVLVDGEEFFGDDPTLVTKNLRADMIDKVQLYDKKSDRAVFTGIDDGKKEKTINLQLKKENKVGYFGKATGGLTTNSFYQSEAMFNFFNNDLKFAIYGFANNIGIQGLSRNEQKISSDGNDNVNLSSNELDSWDGKYSGQGLPEKVAGGLFYSNKWNSGKQEFNGSYNFNTFKVTGDIKRSIQQSLPNSSFFNKLSQNFDNNMINNNFNGTLKIKLDSLSSLQLTLKGAAVNKETNNDFYTQVSSEDYNNLNTTDRSVNTMANNQAFSENISWKKKFRKARRTIEADLNQYNSFNNSEGTLNTKSIVYSNQQTETITLNQFKTNESNSSIFYSKITYTEPITISTAIAINYGLSLNAAKSLRNTFDLQSNGLIGPLDSLYSNHYQFHQFIQKGGVSYHYSKGKVRWEIGNDIAKINLEQLNIFNDFNQKRSFYRWFPRISTSYNFSKSSSLSLNYNGNTIIPSIEQIQPINNNIDPLNIFIGNANLKPAFANNYSGNYTSYKSFSSSFLNIYGNFSLVNNPITVSIQTDETTGNNTYKYLNLEGKSNISYSGQIFHSFKTKLWKIGCSVEAGLSGSNYQMISNNQNNQTNYNNYKMRLSLGKAKDKLYNVGVGFGGIYNVTSNSLQPLFNNNSWSFTVNPNFDFFLPSKIQIHTDGRYLWQEKTKIFNNNFSQFIWNAWIEKYVSHNNLSIKFSINDVLNQNRGFERNSYNNFITQSYFNTIKRQLMLSVVYNLKKFKSDASK